MRNRRTGTTLASTAMIMLAIAGCTEEDKAMQPTETKTQAVQRVDTLLKEAFVQLPDDVTTTTNLNVDAVPCDAPTDGRIFAERRDIVTAPAGGTWQVTEALPTLAAYWEKAGYKTITDERTADLPHYDVTIAANSPCIWETAPLTRSSPDLTLPLFRSEPGDSLVLLSCRKEDVG
jgi:hypothetical protein